MEAQEQLLITQDKLNPPLAEEEKPSFKESLENLFPEQQYQEKSIQKAKEVLETLADEFTAEHLKDVVTEIQYLAESWLDDFERKIFDGKTLKELLHEKGPS